MGRSIRAIYQPKYMLANIAALAVYYFVFNFLIRYQDYGIFLVNVPTYLIYAMIASASVLLTISVYSINNTRRNQAKFTASSVSAVALFLGSMFGGCGCAEPLIMGLAAFGISSGSLFSVNAIMTVYSIQIFYVLILFNLVFVVYYLNKLSKPSCALKTVRK